MVVVSAPAADKIGESFTRTSNKMGCSPAYLLKPTHGDIAVADRQYQDNVYDYHLVKNTNNALKKIVVADIDEQHIKGAKDMVMVYAKSPL